MVRRYIFLVLSGVVSLICGCRAADRVCDPQYASLAHPIALECCVPDSAVSIVPPACSDLEGPHPVEDYILLALDRNPEIHAARKNMEASAHQIPVAGSLQDPMLSVTVQPEPVQTAAGQQELMVSASQKLPWFGKRDARAHLAEAQTGVARAQLAATELSTVEKVKRHYYELYFLQQALRVTETEKRLLLEIRAIANTRYTTGKVSQQDVLRADTEIAVTENELIRLRQQLESTQARLARVLHIAPQTRLLAQEQLPDVDAPGDLDRLQRQAIAARPELHAQLAVIARNQQAVELARLDYRSDVTLGMSWIDVATAGISPVSNGRDSFLLTAGVNLPVYRTRLDSSLRSAEAKAVSSAREYDALCDATLEEVTDLFAQARSQQELRKLLRSDILPAARQTLEVSTKAYHVGEVDFLQLIDNWRQLLRYEISLLRLEATLRQTLAQLERAVGGFVESDEPPASGFEELPQPATD